MTNNLRKIKHDLCAFAKRTKDFKYTNSALITFLITGMVFTANILVAAPADTSIENQKQAITTSIKSLHQQVNATRRENNKLLKNTNLELIKLMEQGDHVVKSPWSSWQYGMNYFNSNWNGTYKGRGDKQEKYPYEGMFTRSENIYERNISTLSSNYSSLGKSRNPISASSNSRSGLISSYGIASTEPVVEPLVDFEVSASINPRNINKSAITVASKTAVTPTLPKAISFTPPKPVIETPKDPYTPDPPTFAVVLGADCNEGCDSDRALTPRQRSVSSSFTQSAQNTTAWLHYTWRRNNLAEKSYAFKMYAETDTTNITNPVFSHQTSHANVGANTKPSGNEYYFNSYNIAGEFGNSIAASEGTNRNDQYFFIGGSRFWEIDNYNSSWYSVPNNTYEFPSGKTLNLGGILTLGMVSQENGAILKNSGTITDKEEKNDKYIKDMTPDSGKDYKSIYGPNDVEYKIKRSTDGYVGYKVGIAQVEENSRTGWGISGGTRWAMWENQQLQNAGTIDFRGGHSIGMYVYLPKQARNYDTMVTYAKMINLQNANIFLSGAESYGMKIAAHSDSNAEMRNEGNIFLRKNEAAQGGNDKADNSAAMALMEDTSVSNDVSLATGKAVNTSTGTISLTDVENSLGMFVNIDSDMTNKGKIIINSEIAEDTSNQPVNVAMRAEHGTGKGGTTTRTSNAKVINENEISLKGRYAIGQLARIANASNTSTGKIITDGTVKNATGISNLGGIITNDGEITLKGSGVSNNIGIFSKSYTYNSTVYNPEGTLGSTSNITVTGDSSTGVLALAGKLNYGGNTTVQGNGVAGLVVGDNDTNTATVTATSTGKITVNDGSGGSAGVYEYTSGGNTVKKGSYGIIVGKGSILTGSGTTYASVDANVKGEQSIGVYAGENAVMTLNDHTVKAYDGAVNYDADNGSTITLKGTGDATTGQKSLLFYLGSSGTGKILLQGNTTANIQGGSDVNTRGTAFYYVGSGYSSFDTTAIQNWASNNFGNTLNKLTLNMASGSRLFIAQDVGMNLSDTTGSTVSTVTGATINGSDYKTFMLYLSKLAINQDVNLDDSADAYNQLEISNSSIDNNITKTITGTQANQVAMAQENNSALYNRDKVKLNNYGNINLSGTGSTGMYAKFGEIHNQSTGTITMGDSSTAMYGIDDSLLENRGTITLGNNSTGIYSEGATSQGITNYGTIQTSGNDSVALLYTPASTASGVAVENASGATINMTGDRNTAIYATGIPAYTAKNSGNITLGASASLSNPNVGIYTDNQSVTLENAAGGTITSGDNTIGVYGYNVNNSGDITIGNGGIGVYSQSGNVNLSGGTITTGTDEAVGVYTVGSGQTISNTGTTFNLGNNSFGFVNVGSGNTITSTLANNNLGTDSVYIYSNDTAGTVSNSTNLSSTGNENYGIYSAGTVNNSGNITYSNNSIGNVGIFSVSGGSASNSGTITVGASDSTKNLYSIAMAAGYIDNDKNSATYGKVMTTGNITNSGTLKVNGKSSIGMYAVGSGSTATNGGTIELNGDNTTGIYVDEGATAVNTGTIKTGSGAYTNVVGVYLGTGSKLNNTGTINIDASKGIGVYLKGGTIANYGTITVSGAGSQNTYKFERADTSKSVGGIKIDTSTLNPVITVNGVPVAPTILSTNMTGNPKTVSASSLGLYVDTSGVNYTKSIENLSALTSEADLIVGTEITEQTNSKYILITDPNIITPYKNAIDSTKGSVTWTPYSAGITWQASAVLDGNNSLTGLIMAKTPYTYWAGRMATPVNSTDTYNFLDGLEQRYGVEALGTRERALFQKLNGIGNNEEILLYQAFDEMMGHQYGNLQQRINATGNILDKEFKYLKHDWRNPSKQNNKIKVFGMRDEYNTDTAGIIDYTSNAYGVAYVHEDEKIKMGNSSGWYAGAVTNRFKFKDIGHSRENQTQIKAGIFKTMSPKKDYNGALQWTIGGDVFFGINNMKRRYLVVDDIFQAKSDYNSYGAALKTDLGYDIRMSERTHLRPYGALKMEYGRFNKIKEDNGEMRLEVKGNDYFSVKPEVGVEFRYVQPLAVRTNLTVGLSAAYENELGKVGDVNNEGRVRYTNADWFGIRGEKEDRKGNGKFDLNIGVDNTRFGVTVNGGYDTKGKNVRGGIGFRAIY